MPKRSEIIDEILAKSLLVKHVGLNAPATLFVPDNKSHKRVGEFLQAQGMCSDDAHFVENLPIPVFGWKITDLEKFQPYESKLKKIAVIEVPEGFEKIPLQDSLEKSVEIFRQVTKLVGEHFSRPSDDHEIHFSA